MSDTIYRIFPRHPRQICTDEQIIEAVNALKLTSAEKITFTNYGDMQFIDCGEGLEHVFCQWCGYELGLEYWSEAMSKAYIGNAFKHLELEMPCCGLRSSLNELIYVKPCGFATFAIEVRNPTTMPCNVELEEMGKCFGCVRFFRMIFAHI